MSGMSDKVSTAALRWGIWVLSLGKLDIQDLIPTMVIPKDMDPSWLDEDVSDVQASSTGGSDQENLGSGTIEEKVLKTGEDQNPLVNTSKKSEPPEEETENQGVGKKLPETENLGTGDDSGKTEIVKEAKKEVEIKEDDKISQPSPEEQEEHIFESSMIRYNFKLNYYGKLANKIGLLFGIEGKTEDAEKLLDLFYKYTGLLNKLLKISTFKELQGVRKRLDRGFQLMEELEKTVKELSADTESAEFDQTDSGTWEPCAVRYATKAVSKFIASSYEAADLELRRTFQAGDRHQGGKPLKLNTPMHDHGSIDRQGISFKFLKFVENDNRDRRVQLYVYDFAENRKGNTYVWSRGNESSGPSDAN